VPYPAKRLRQYIFTPDQFIFANASKVGPRQHCVGVRHNVPGGRGYLAQMVPNARVEFF
jgi:hypothetical protein